MANYSQGRELERTPYEAKKEEVALSARALLKKLYPEFNGQLRFTDVFSPTTIERYTCHLDGTVYGSIDKTRDGRTPVDNLFIIGTDQGFLGIVGAMLSGISMANLHGLMGEAT
jgi:phytoene dehydrogenase-like protein